VPLLAAVVLAAAVIACSIYANLSFAVKDRANYRFFPPFKPNVNNNLNDHLGGEYFNMARALAAGEGFAHPFDGPTGPTAWQHGWLVLLAVDLLIAGVCWCRPLQRWKPAAGWGLFGGIAALINPGVGLGWGLLSICLAAAGDESVAGGLGPGSVARLVVLET